MEEKVIIFSHESDIDGMGGVILGKLAFNNIQYVLSPGVVDLENKFRKMLEEKSLYQYDKIYVTDLALSNPSLEMVSKDSILSKKVLIFDHHASSIKEGLGIYDFTKIIEKDESGLSRCGTDLFYDYLCNNGYLTKSPKLDTFVELTRLEDSWKWKKEGSKGIKAHDLAILYNSIGIEKYIESMYQKLISSSTLFEFSKEEELIIKKRKEEYTLKLKSIYEESEVFMDESNNKFVAVFANYEYRNELIEYVRALDKKPKYLVVVALDKGPYGQKSYRSIEPLFNVERIAKKHGGGGHLEAASVNITKEQRENATKLDKRNSLEYLVNSSYIE